MQFNCMPHPEACTEGPLHRSMPHRHRVVLPTLRNAVYTTNAAQRESDGALCIYAQRTERKSEPKSSKPTTSDEENLSQMSCNKHTDVSGRIQFGAIFNWVTAVKGSKSRTDWMDLCI